MYQQGTPLCSSSTNASIWKPDYFCPLGPDYRWLLLQDKGIMSVQIDIILESRNFLETLNHFNLTGSDIKRNCQIISLSNLGFQKCFSDKVKQLFNKNLFCWLYSLALQFFLFLFSPNWVAYCQIHAPLHKPVKYLCKEQL